ncbi:hypothetical protein [Pseudoflavitalea rhizosphaerae]|uniref:hypothetical protein n=1 Tax=Pseudoflavitalea rhizosphaerae TaxID=1884793 RepID=UPI000F8DF543|nr:hypothetical protein [Pseudoflavitalea rhizosphaerae]
MDSNQKLSKTTALTVLLIGVLGIVGFLILQVNSYIKVRQIKKDGIYVVGKNTSSTSSKSGRSYYFTYVLNGSEYEKILTDVSNKYKEGDIVFFQVSSSEPSKSIWNDDFPRPGPCITFETAPPDGWKEIPVCK